MSKIFRYILKSDAGMAPCIDRGLVTLAICKPQIRRGARKDDWVIGFRPLPDSRGLVVWAGRVADSKPVGAYQRRYPNRRDAIYREKENGTFERLLPKYHEGDFHKDIAAPVLIFDRKATWYFGDKARPFPKALMHLAATGRPTRVHGVRVGDFELLAKWLQHSAPGIHGKPLDGDYECLCKPRKRRKYRC
jgi:hypothetical protein